MEVLKFSPTEKSTKATDFCTLDGERERERERQRDVCVKLNKISLYSEPGTGSMSRIYSAIALTPPPGESSCHLTRSRSEDPTRPGDASGK